MIQVVYHNKDLDGFVSGYILSKHYHDDGHQVKMIGYDYGNPIPEFLEGVDIAMSDISFPPEEMLRLKNNIVLWVDHHRSAIEASEEFGYADIPGIRKEGDSATLLAWNYLNNGNTPPFLVAIVDRYDVFKQKTFNFGGPSGINLCWDDVLKFQHGLRTKISDPCSFDGWESIEDLMYWMPTSYMSIGFLVIDDYIYKIGEAIFNLYAAENERRAKNLYVCNVGQYKIGVIYGERPDINVLDFVEDKAVGALAFLTIGPTGITTVSLRKLKDCDFDILEFAKANKGGGHPCACGFRTRHFFEDMKVFGG